MGGKWGLSCLDCQECQSSESRSGGRIGSSSQLVGEQVSSIGGGVGSGVVDGKGVEQ